MFWHLLTSPAIFSITVVFNHVNGWWNFILDHVLLNLTKIHFGLLYSIINTTQPSPAFGITLSIIDMSYNRNAKHKMELTWPSKSVFLRASHDEPWLSMVRRNGNQNWTQMQPHSQVLSPFPSMMLRERPWFAVAHVTTFAQDLFHRGRVNK